MALQDYFDIGQALKRVRKENGLTQSAFAKLLEIPVTTLSGYERNAREIPKQLLEQILETFGYTFSYFAGLPDFDKYTKFLQRCESLGLYVQYENLDKGYCRIGFSSTTVHEVFTLSKNQLNQIIKLNDDMLLTHLSNYLPSEQSYNEYNQWLLTKESDSESK